MAETYINFYLPNTSNQWEKLNLTRPISDCLGLQEALDRRITKGFLFDESNKIRVSLFSDHILGQLVCGGSATVSSQTFVSNIRTINENIFNASMSNNNFMELWGSTAPEIEISDIKMHFKDYLIDLIKIYWTVTDNSMGANYTPRKIEFYSVDGLGDKHLRYTITSSNLNDYKTDIWYVTAWQHTASLEFLTSATRASFTNPLEVKLENLDVVFQLIQKHSKIINWASYIDNTTYYLCHEANSVWDSEKERFFLSYLDCPAVFFNMVLNADSKYTNQFKGREYTTGDWCLATIAGWELISNIAIIKSFNDQSAGGSLYTYGGSISDNNIFHAGTLYYNNVFHVYGNQANINIKPTSLINSLVLCISTIEKSKLSSDTYEEKHPEYEVTHNFSKYFITSNRTLDREHEIPQGTGVNSNYTTTNKVDEILTVFEDWQNSLQEYITSNGGIIPIKNPSGHLVNTSFPTWGRHVLYYEDDQLANFGENETTTNPSTDKDGLEKWDFYIEFPQTTN